MVCRLAVEKLRALVVHLVEGKGGDLYLHPRQNIPDIGFPEQHLGLPAQDDVGPAGVDV